MRGALRVGSFWQAMEFAAIVPLTAIDGMTSARLPSMDPGLSTVLQPTSA